MSDNVAREPAHAAASATAAIVGALAAGFSIEVTPREVRQHPGLLAANLPVGTRVYITFLAGHPYEETVTACELVRNEGMVPVPHLAARNIPDLAMLDRIVGLLAGVGVSELLVIGGSLSTPAGEIGETLQVLRSGVLERHGIDRVGVAGHPEGNKDIGEPGLEAALAAKNAFARDSAIELYLLTQFGFAAEPVVAWERRIRAQGNTLPVCAGLPGLSTPVKLLRFGLACGVGASLKVLRKQSGGVLKLASSGTYHPDETMVGIARAVRDDPDTLIRGIHYFPFGAVEATASWVRAIAAGRVQLDDVRGRLTVHEVTA